jgi:hypothetical protein
MEKSKFGAKARKLVGIKVFEDETPYMSGLSSLDLERF